MLLRNSRAFFFEFIFYKIELDMKNKIIITFVFVGLFSLSSCAIDEECVCDNITNVTDSDAKDVGVTLDEACTLARNGDETCRIE